MHFSFKVWTLGAKRRQTCSKTGPFLFAFSERFLKVTLPIKVICFTVWFVYIFKSYLLMQLTIKF